jgi:hypothetical protein
MTETRIKKGLGEYINKVSHEHITLACKAISNLETLGFELASEPEICDMRGIKAKLIFGVAEYVFELSPAMDEFALRMGYKTVVRSPLDKARLFYNQVKKFINE